MKINDGHFLELMDRIHVQSCTIETHLLDHPLTKQLKKVKKLINRSHKNLLDAYQIVGQKSFENDEQKNPIKKVILRRHKNSKKRWVGDSEKL